MQERGMKYVGIIQSPQRYREFPTVPLARKKGKH